MYNDLQRSNNETHPIIITHTGRMPFRSKIQFIIEALLIDDNAIDIEPGLYGGTLEHAGVEREYVIYFLPTTTPALQAPALELSWFWRLCLDHMEWADFRSIANNEGFVWCTHKGHFWTESLTGTPPPQKTTKVKPKTLDLRWNSLMIVLDYNLDPERVYVDTRMAVFSYALPAITGTKSLPWQWPQAPCLMAYRNLHHRHPHRRMVLHGTNDYVVPTKVVMAMRALVCSQLWTDHNDINTSAIVESMVRLTFTAMKMKFTCKVAHFRVNGGDHIWFNLIFTGKAPTSTSGHFSRALHKWPQVN